MLTISIYRGDQRSKAHAAFDGDFFQTIPELVFKADAGFVVCNLNRALRRALRNRKVQPAPQTYHRVLCFSGSWENREHGRKPTGPIMPVASGKPHARSIAADQHADSVMFDLMQPPFPAGGLAAGLGRQGSQESGKATRRDSMAE